MLHQEQCNSAVKCRNVQMNFRAHFQSILIRCGIYHGTQICIQRSLVLLELCMKGLASQHLVDLCCACSGRKVAESKPYTQISTSQDSNL